MKRFISLVLLLSIVSCSIFIASKSMDNSPTPVRKWDVFDISPATPGTVREVVTSPERVDLLTHSKLEIDSALISELMQDFEAANPGEFDSAILTLQVGWKSWMDVGPTNPDEIPAQPVIIPPQLGVTPFGRTYVKSPGFKIDPIPGAFNFPTNTYGLAYATPNISNYTYVASILELSMEEYGKLVASGALTNVFQKRDKYQKVFELQVRFTLDGDPVTLSDNLSFNPVSGMYIIGTGEVEFVRENFLTPPLMFHNITAEVIE